MRDILDRISILITSYKNTGLLRRCIDSLIDVYGDRLPETVIVDDAAGDVPTRELAEGYAKRGVKFAVMPQNGGFAGANNFGYSLCTKEFIVLVNSDIVFHADSLSPLISFMDSHPRAGIASGTLVIRNGGEVDGLLNGCGAYLTSFGINTLVGWLAKADDPVAQEARQCFAAYGAMFAIRRGVVETTCGGLFHDFFHMYYEEVNFCHRAWLAGWEVWYVPTPIADHAHGATSGRFLEREAVLRKFYRNLRFSYLTCFGVRGLLTIYPMFEILAIGQALVPLFRLKGMYFRAHIWSWWQLLKMSATIWQTRRKVQRSRTIGDAALFKIIKRPYSFREFLNAARESFS